KGDTVEIIAGKDHGKRGEVLRVMPNENRVVVQGLNVRKKHQRAQPNRAGGRQLAPEILQFEAPLNASNVMLVCPKCGELTRVGYLRAEGQPVRICRKCKDRMDA
ncbi:MAG: 50S ribosomal protein L24, partial [Anaerolineales bacterium]